MFMRQLTESCVTRRGYHLLGRCVWEILNGQKIEWLYGELGVRLHQAAYQTQQRAYDG